MASYGWTEYDGRLGGKQVLSDRGMKIDIETEFVKVPGTNGMCFVDSWSKIRGELGSQNQGTAKG